MDTGQVLLQIDLTSEPSGDGQLQWTTMSEDGQWLVTATASWPKGDGSKHVKLHVQDVDGKRPATDIEVATGYVAGPFLSAEAGTIGILRKELGKGFWVEFWDLASGKARGRLPHDEKIDSWQMLTSKGSRVV